MDLGAAIKNIRKEKGLAQGELAAKSFISSSSLSQIENGHKRPYDATLWAICEALEITPAYLYVSALEQSDVPEGKNKFAQDLFPNVKQTILLILQK